MNAALLVDEARVRFGEWFTFARPPGRRVRFRVPFVAVEVERIWSFWWDGKPKVDAPRTGHRFRHEGWFATSPEEQDRISRIRLVVPWPGGCLWIMEARD